MSETLTTLKAAYKAWHDTKGKSVDVWLDLCADGFTFRSLAEGQTNLEFTARRQSKADVRGYFEGLAADWDMIHYTPAYFVEDGDRIVMFGQTAWRNRRTGTVLDTPKADFWRFENGKAVEFFEMYDTGAAQKCACP